MELSPCIFILSCDPHTLKKWFIFVYIEVQPTKRSKYSSDHSLSYKI